MRFMEVVHRSRSAALLVIVLAGLISLLARNRSSEAQLKAVMVSMQDLTGQIAVARLEDAAFVEAVNRQAWGGPFLGGHHVQAGSDIRIDRPDDGIYYMIRSTCQACPRNYPVIKRLSDSLPGKVFIVSLDDSAASLVPYAAEHGLTSMLVGSSHGHLLTNIPEYATPITLLFKDGKLVKSAQSVTAWRRY